MCLVISFPRREKDKAAAEAKKAQKKAENEEKKKKLRKSKKDTRDTDDAGGEDQEGDERKTRRPRNMLVHDDGTIFSTKFKMSNVALVVNSVELFADTILVLRSQYVL